jgi:hypothetical protein
MDKEEQELEFLDMQVKVRQSMKEQEFILIKISINYQMTSEKIEYLRIS